MKRTLIVIVSTLVLAGCATNQGGVGNLGETSMEEMSEPTPVDPLSTLPRSGAPGPGNALDIGYGTGIVRAGR